MMHVLIGIALKSLLIAGLTLGLLKLLRERSAAERSWVAHIGLLALVIMAFAPLVLPSWSVETPALFERAPAVTAAPASVAPASTAPATAGSAPVALPQPTAASPTTTAPALSSTAAATALYALPAAILLMITFLALARLFALRARADVLVDSHWLSALARAQRRMGFKHGTALLTSDDLASPISWGLMRPVILLNSRAVEATGEAEAIIAHELAHVARMDWVKLLLARVATALFWFNPLVWMLAREAHQLREEAADDSVLAADIVDTDYAQLLVGVARHECPGLLLGAHGVAPSKSSLARRVARVLDGKSVRGPVARSFALGVFAGAVLVAAPLAALTLTPSRPQAHAAPAAADRAASRLAAIEPYYEPADVPTDLGSIIASGVSTSVQTAVAAATGARAAEVAAPITVERAREIREAALERAQDAREAAADAREDARQQAREAVVEARRGGAYARAVAVTSLGITPEYISAMRSAAPRLGRLGIDDFQGLKAVGVTPDYARGMVAAGFGSITADELMQARAVGLTGDYVSALRAIGVRGNLDDYIELRAVGVTPDFAARAKASGVRIDSTSDLVELRVLGPTRPPSVRKAPPPPAPPPPGWNPIGDNPDG